MEGVRRRRRRPAARRRADASCAPGLPGLTNTPREAGSEKTLSVNKDALLMLQGSCLSKHRPPIQSPCIKLRFAWKTLISRGTFSPGAWRTIGSVINILSKPVRAVLAASTSHMQTSMCWTEERKSLASSAQTQSEKQPEFAIEFIHMHFIRTYFQ